MYIYIYIHYESRVLTTSALEKVAPLHWKAPLDKNTSIGNIHFSDFKRHSQWLQRRFPMEVKLPIAFSNAREPDFPMSERWPVCKHRMYKVYVHLHISPLRTEGMGGTRRPKK